MKIAYDLTLVKKIFSKNKLPYSINIDEYSLFPFALWNLNEVFIDPSCSVHSTEIAHVCVYVIVATERPWSVRPNPLSLGLPMWSETILKCILASLWHNYVKCKNSIWSKHWVQHWKAEGISLTQIVSMWFPVCWATLPVSVIWLWDFCTPGTPRPWGFGHLFVRFFINLVEKERRKKRYHMKRMTLLDYTTIKTHI